MNASSSESSAPRIMPNTANAFGGIWRLTLNRYRLPAYWLTLVVSLALLVLLYIGSLRNGSPHKYLEWTIGFYINFLVPAISFMTGAGVIRDEMKSSTVDYVLTRPVPRPFFILFKYVAHTLCMQLDFIFAFVVVLIFASVSGIPGIAATGIKLLYGQVLLIAAFGAFGFLCGIITSRYYLIGIAYGLVIEIGVGQIPTQLSKLSMTHQMRLLLKSLLHLAEPLIGTPSLFGTTVAIMAFTALMLGAAATLFTFLEFRGAGDS